MAIVYTFQAWRHICLSTPFPIDVYMDHNNLMYYQQPHKINQCVARYLMEMEEFNFQLIHKPRRINKVDVLLQNPGLDMGDDDNEDVVVLPEWLFIRVVDALLVEQEVIAD